MSRGRYTLAAVLLAMLVGGGAVASADSSHRTGFITFVRGGDKGPTTAWIANPDGSGARELGVGDEAFLSPNGEFVSVQRYTSSGSALELFSTSGKLLAGFFNAATYSAATLAWSTNSRYLAVTATNTKSVGKMSLDVIDTHTLKTRQVTGGVIAGASFNPAGTQLVFGMAKSESITAPVNLYSVPVTGGRATQLTTDGHSFDPVWARTGIFFDRSTSRGMSKAPIFQLWLLAGGQPRQLTDMKIPDLLDGLTPLEADADGNRLIVEYTGQDTSYAWTLQLSPLKIQELRVDGQPVQGGQISSNGQRLLVDVGGFEQSPNHGEVESVSFAGGAPMRLSRGTEPSWNS